MQLKTVILSFFTFITIGFILVKPFACNASIEQNKWQGKDRFGNILTEKDLKELLVKYQSDFEQLMEKSISSNAGYVVTSSAPDFTIDLEGAMLDGANLSAIVQEIGVPFTSISINLKNAKLRKTNLQSLQFYYSDFTGAEFSLSDLKGTVIAFSKLDGALFSKANLTKSNILGSSLNNTTFTSAEMKDVVIHSTGSEKVFLSGANLENARLSGDFKNSTLQNTNLKGAKLGPPADFSFSKFIDTNIEGVNFLGSVNLTKVQYEAKSIPSINTLANIIIEDIWFRKGRQTGLILLRKSLKDSGLRDQERKVTYYIEKGKTNYAFFVERYLKRLFFEYACGYGLNYFRPIIILLLLMILSSFIYLIPISGCCKDGIFMKWSEDRINQDIGSLKPERLKFEGYKVISYSLYFSILSAFHFGWRDLNIGNWIARMQPREYTLRPTGWVRSFSGIQSLISIYLLALWVLSYFGRPFG